MVHSIDMKLPVMPVVNSDVTFAVKKDGKKLGTIAISRGGIDWYPRNKQIPTAYTWDQIAELLGPAPGT